MIPSLLFNIPVAIVIGILGFLIARSSGCTFDDFNHK